MLHSFPVTLLDRLCIGEPTVVFLDSARPSLEQRYSLLFINPLRIYRCPAGRDVAETLEEISKEAGRHWIAGYCSYEAAYWLEEKFAPLRRRKTPRGDLLWFGVFEEPFIFDHVSGGWNRPPEIPGNAQAESSRAKDVSPPRTSLRFTRRRYFPALRRIKEFIAAGDVYQVNFTYDITVSSPLRPWELYKELRLMQPVPFGAFIKTRGATVASFSPELFFLRQGARIRVRPMKGTARRGRFSAEDDANARALVSDPKNRSENIMIVDLLRNDLGRICAPGAVAVRRLFEVERHPTVLQMTSTVDGRLRSRTGFADTVRALFPSGSVTGAPKIRAMEIIGGLERGTRGVYCGAIGYSSPRGRQVFSVPIRTLQKNAGRKEWQFRVGSGVVWDSSPRDEWRECLDKCDFLTALRPDFMLFESLLFSRGNFRCLREHRRRLFASARHFGIPVEGNAWKRTVRKIRNKLAAKRRRSFKARIFCSKSGKLSWDRERISPVKTVTPATVRLCGKPVDPGNPFLFHKTTLRPWYAKDMDDIRAKKVFDVIHVNKRGELTEGAISNLFVKINGKLFTPPVECGLLPGVLRGRLLKTGTCREKILRREDIKNAEAVFCGNSVRGLVKVAVAPQAL
jgi:para-aminobenzoate synthetase/4-amino-4-deoxychorismate lyase